MDAVVVCAGRWGIDKTTVDDVAREAGVSRSTIYRLFPGGKPVMVRLTAQREVLGLLGALNERLLTCSELSDAVTTALCEGYRAVEAQPALAYMRKHQPATVRAFLSLERLDLMFAAAADVLSGSFERFVEPRTARELVIWIARLVVSHYLNPDPAHPLGDASVALHLAESHVLVGLSADASGPNRSNTHEESR